MILRNLLPTGLLALALALSLTACDDGDDADAGDAADSNDSNAEETGADDIDCATYCTGFIDMCLQTGNSTEFETNDACVAACGAWDQAGTNCRYEQIIAGACDQAGNMGSTCQ